jgi:sugar lactone lactonase YvrE
MSTTRPGPERAAFGYRRQRRFAFPAGPIFALFATASCGADDPGLPHASVVVAFDGTAGEFPEGVAIGAAGEIYTSLAPLGKLIRVSTGANAIETVATVEGLVEGDLGLLGIAIGPHGDVFGAVASDNPSVNGVWRFPVGGQPAMERVAGTDVIAFPNAIVFDGTTMYVTDTIGPDGKGAVWSVPQGGEAALWAQSDLFAGDGSAGFGIPLGPNGIAIHEHTLFVGLTEPSAIAAIPITDSGTSGGVSIFADLRTAGTDGAPIAVDGIESDGTGALYVAAPLLHAVFKVSASGADVETVATGAEGLDAPVNVALGDQALYVSNFSAALGEVSNGNGPAIIRLAR